MRPRRASMARRGSPASTSTPTRLRPRPERSRHGVWAAAGAPGPDGGTPDKRAAAPRGSVSFAPMVWGPAPGGPQNLRVGGETIPRGGGPADPAGNKPGRNLGYTRFDKM